VNRSPSDMAVEAQFETMTASRIPLSDAGGDVMAATVADHNAAFDAADEALGGAYRAGFREGWIFAQAPDGTDYDEISESYGRAVDIEPSEAWSAERDRFFAMLPLPAIPEVGAALSTLAPDDADGVIQADRDAAARFIISAETEQMVLWGKADQQPLVQAFKNHRLVVHTPPPSRPTTNEGEIG
jgi:hypothetical protein